jgi:hypothetical protein
MMGWGGGMRHGQISDEGDRRVGLTMKPTMAAVEATNPTVRAGQSALQRGGGGGGVVALEGIRAVEEGSEGGAL